MVTPLAPARSGCGQRALSASNSSPDVKTQSPGHPSRRFQSTEGQQKMAFPGSRLPPPPLPGGAGRDCPPARNCPRRLAPVGPDSTLPAPKKRFLSLRQCRMANVAALSGLTVAWRRVFRAAGQDCPADTGGRAFEQGILPFFSHLKLPGRPSPGIAKGETRGSPSGRIGPFSRRHSSPWGTPFADFFLDFSIRPNKLGLFRHLIFL